MKKLLNTLKYILIFILIILIISTIIHHIMLKIEFKEIIPNGTIISVNEHNMHVYSEGNSSENPTLVFMSGSGTVAPVYDFKPLYSKLTDKYHIAIIEKAGYGYSEIYTVSRDIDTMLEETRKALELAGKNPPYILLPHSMSGIEAIYWSQKYPDEIKCIIGLDMAVPEHYEYLDFDAVNLRIKIGQVSTFLGLHRTLSFVYPLNVEGLTSDEIKQQKYLMYKNAVNKNIIDEGQAVKENSNIVKNGGYAECNMLFFVSNGEEIGDYWIPCIESYADLTNSAVIYLDVPHYIHYFESENIAKEISLFLD